MPDRRAHLVGSLPGPDARTAMTTALDVLGPHLRSLPDGETGERRNWVGSAIEGLASHPDLEPRAPAQDGHAAVLRVRRGHRLYGATMDLGHLAAARESYPVFREVAGARVDDGLTFQQGVPGNLDTAVLTMGFADGLLRRRRAFTEATLAEVFAERALLPPSTLFQIEVPILLASLVMAPPRVRRPLASVLARSITRLAGAAPVGTRFAVHLCVGDQDHRAAAVPDDAGPLVLLANAIVQRWPAGRELVLLHAPFAAADQPASTGAAFYEPLRHLELPAEMAFAAGFAHEEQDLAAQVGIRDRAEEILGREIVISSACGLGRRSEVAGLAVLRRHAELCTAA